MSSADLATALATLGSDVRLAILRQLRTPRAIREIEVEAEKGRARPLSRQGVREHIERLLEVGVVDIRAREGDGAETREFSVNHQTIYALAEELRDLARLRAVVEPDRPTSDLTQPWVASAEGDSIVLVKGLDEGRLFPLPPRDERWTIGRKRGAHVSLDFDPFVSSENSTLHWRGDVLVITDLATNANGTFVNFRPLPRGGERALFHGDVIGVGRTLLLHWRARKPDR